MKGLYNGLTPSKTLSIGLSGVPPQRSVGKTLSIKTSRLPPIQVNIPQLRPGLKYPQHLEAGTLKKRNYVAEEEQELYLTKADALRAKLGVFLG